jgi:hypothetical protein
MKYLIFFQDCRAEDLKLVDAKNKYEALKKVCDYVYFKNNVVCYGENEFSKKIYYAKRLKSTDCFKSQKNFFTVVQPYNLVTNEEIFYKFDLNGNFLKSKII